jgi:MFS transporter, DHA2 family, multidrug resistance protein
VSASYPAPKTRAVISLSTMIATLMVTLDATIANVALPHMQSSVSASQEQIVWVLTSYLIAEAIATPLSAWLASRYGRKTIMVASVIGFTACSAACGAAGDLFSLVAFRTLQGAFGAALVPLSQAVLFDINPPRNHGQAMAIYGLGAMLGPVIGPLLGGVLTDALSWRWVFLINLPFGLLSCLGMIFFMPETPRQASSRFDFLGFAFLSVFLASLQLLLDRGQQLDWFASWEIRSELTIALMAAYLTVTHTLTARNSFIDPSLFADRNYLFGSILSAMLGVLIFGVIPLVSTMLQELMNYPVIHAGTITAPRGLGTMISMIVVGLLIRRVDYRLLMLIGLCFCAIGMYQLSGMSLYADGRLILISGLLQGFSGGFIFVPLSIVVFSTLNERQRNEGSALFALTRNVGAAIGISYLQSLTIRNVARVQSRLSEAMVPGSPVLEMRAPGLDLADPASASAMAAQIARHATMVAYVDSFWLLLIVTLLMMPLVLLIRPSGNAVPPQA